MKLSDGAEELRSFSLIEALLGRRSRRFFLGASIPDGVFAYTSAHAPVPLSQEEQLLLLAACAGNTGWHSMIYRGEHYAPYLSNYCAAAGGRTFPSAAGFHTSMTFFTDDEGVYVLDNRDAPPPAERGEDGIISLEEMLEGIKGSTKKLQDGRLRVETAAVEAHNTWVFNKPGTLLIIPVADMAQHVLLALCYLLQNRAVIMDDLNKRTIPGIEQYADIADVDSAWPLTFLDQLSLEEASVEIASSCYAGTLMLQAMGLGGWMFDGVDPFKVLGVSDDPAAPGLGFRCDRDDDRWPFPNPTGRPGVMEAFCPPFFPDMRTAVDAVCGRKFGPGGPYHGDTPGPWRNSRKVRLAAQVHDSHFKDCVTLQAQYILDTFGKFPATVPSMVVVMYLQAHHLDLEFYDRFYKPGAYLRTHAQHMELWHKAK